LKHERSTGGVQETAALYALGSLSQHDARAFESHLKEGCSACSGELKRFQGVIGCLGLTASDAEPPVYLRELLVAHIEHSAPTAMPEAAAQARKEPPVISTPRARSPLSFWSKALSWIMAVGCAMLAAYSYYYWKQSEQSVQERTAELVAARSDSEQLSKMLELERGRSRELEHLNAILERPGARVLLLAGAEPTSSASAAIFWDVARRRWVVTGRLPQAGPGTVYKLWYVTRTGRYGAGILPQDSEGHVFAVLEAPEPGADVSQTVITLERDAGATQPTWPIIASSGK
jgi:Anti-sigma-K factor rskA, C-terminal